MSEVDAAAASSGARGSNASGGEQSGDAGSFLIDSHCHLQMLEPGEREEALEAARQVGVRGFMVPATGLGEADDLLALCHRHDDVWCALGVHPHEAESWGNGSQRQLEGLLADPKVVAVGECGLDFYYDNAPRGKQERALLEQWELAIEHGLPAVVHNRDSNQAMLELVRRADMEDLAADFHSFAGGLAMGRELIERGFTLGLSGMITFPKADNVREVIPHLPAERRLVETDTPYLAPVPYRGKPNRPAYVVEVARRLAEETGESLEAVTRRSTAAFFRLFRRAAPAA